MKAVILAGGLGTRLSEETAIRPKPMNESLFCFKVRTTAQFFDANFYET